MSSIKMAVLSVTSPTSTMLATSLAFLRLKNQEKAHNHGSPLTKDSIISLLCELRQSRCSVDQQLMSPYTTEVWIIVCVDVCASVGVSGGVSVGV